jgi:DNA (cytosine-5)-methyltransferase 1
MIEINQLDLFSGIGGFHLGFERAGYKVNSYFSEIDKHAVAVYKQQFKNSKYVGSVTNVRGEQLPKIDVITFGSPCQDFSLAGKRKGMEGQRSSLVLEAIRLIGECRPRVFVWENVKGTFSSNDGEDFAAILQSFTNIGGYRLEWQLLNTSWFLPQNRERIYLVGYSTTPGRGWKGVFPIGEDEEVYRGELGKRSWGFQKAQSENLHARTLSSSTQKMAIDSTFIHIKSATKQGYETAQEGDSINLSQPTSKTRRGRVGKQKANTLETSCNQAAIQDYRIRRLTPIECERLQGFPDNHTAFGNYDGEVKPISNTQRYKQCGNAVTVDVVAAVAERLKEIFNA